MGRKKLTENEKQMEGIAIRISSKFRQGLEQAVERANEPSIAEFVKKAIMEKAEKLGVKIKR